MRLITAVDKVSIQYGVHNIYVQVESQIHSRVLVLYMHCIL
jgi:hypothetical protein